MRKPRHLSPEERDLWDSVAGRMKPLDPKRPKTPEPAAPPKKAAPRERDIIQDFMVGAKADPKRPNDVLKPVGARLQSAPVNMDAKNYGRMTKGKLKPEGRLDLHGMTLSEAHPELVAFILGAQAVGKRLVLVITGKGKERDEGYAIPVRNGILRHQVPQWLALPPMAQAILQVTPAHLKHGGHGAYYVYLRRSR
ncbi:Smr/MutS family protein [Loktanella sp. F6476L]|uniref:Smr/MutS family protein n=1 Tax=Loktanella sp. F6476L TaxID=2926405 RepID=UPI001FF6F181|nr:Smr/MutS family protein [Loktanella sp. F6476L]MCK0120757.1 Smr/MutS family protein [Loktanella sp. F6476L]